MKNDSTNDMHLRDADRGLEVLHVQERATMNNSAGWASQRASLPGCHPPAPTFRRAR